MVKETVTKWINIQGDHVLFYPLFHKSPDLISSNSFLFQFPECFIVIDPGGTALHFNAIIELLEEGNIGGEKPVFIVITHCHFDHVRSLHYAPPELIKTFFIGGHTSAIEFLKNADMEHTISFLYTDKIPALKSDFELFSLSKNNSPVELSTPFQNRQMITLPGYHEIIAYHTPGHSNCSVCYQVGNLLFTGDLLFAHNPAVAGTFGWSKPDLYQSLDFLKSLIENEKIEKVYCGHGPELSGDKSIKIINSILNHLPSLKNLALLDNDRYLFLKDCTITFMKEIEHQILAQNGRLLRIASELEKLEEDELAASIIDTSLQDKLDSYILVFHNFLTNYGSNMLHLDVPVQGASLMKMMQNTFNNLTIPPQLTLLYLERLQTLFKSLLTLIRGIDFSMFAETTDLTEIIKNCIELFTQHTLSEKELYELAESKEEFAIYLARRIDGHNRKVDIDFCTDKEQICMANPEHLNALIGDVIESMVSGSSRKITIKSFGDENITGCKFTSNPEWKITGHKAKFYQLFAKLLNGEFKQFDDGSFSFLFQKKGNLQ